MPVFWKDLLERVLWTAVQAAAGAVAVYVTGLPYGWAAVAAAALSAGKGFAARKLGDRDSASTISLS